MTATMDLDADGACEYFGHFASEELRGATLGNTTWEVACGTAANATISNATVTITYVQPLAARAPRCRQLRARGPPGLRTPPPPETRASCQFRTVQSSARDNPVDHTAAGDSSPGGPGEPSH
ncbi:unnamed protein product [Prorocentrum cordatum]|uniref:Uncharacterized protein n=1 Tax=Prorocentrum cordatum TaxID=2364126 RepID=A0ABN9WDA6_9DINO|nr:unnamed protein product [Polarella glacialis]